MNRHQFEQTARQFRAGRITLVDFANRIFPPDAGKVPPVTDADDTSAGSRANDAVHAPPVTALPARAADAHKGDLGRLLVIGGSQSMPGAIALTGLAALRAGSGLVVVATPQSAAPTVATFSPCYMTLGYEWRDGLATKGELAERIEWADLIAIGPGLGREPGARSFTEWLYAECRLPMVIDADALNCLVDGDANLAVHAGQRILTPHPGEFRRLVDIDSVRREDFERAAVELAIRANVVVALKGKDTFVTDGKSNFRNRTGNPGMATGGAGDVLTGMIASFVGQGMNAFEGTCLAVHMHGKAGDIGAKQLGQPGLLATDLIDFLPNAMTR